MMVGFDQQMLTVLFDQWWCAALAVVQGSMQGESVLGRAGAGTGLQLMRLPAVAEHSGAWSPGHSIISIVRLYAAIHARHRQWH